MIKIDVSKNLKFWKYICANVPESVLDLLTIHNKGKASPAMYLAGGIVRAYFDKSKTKDIDVFFSDQEIWKKAISYVSFIDAMSTNAPDSDGDCKYIQSFNYNHKIPKTEWIGFHIPHAVETVLDNFDWTCCQLAFDGKYLYASHSYSIKHAKKKLLYLNKPSGKSFAKCLARREKFKKSYGYTVPDDSTTAFLTHPVCEIDVSGKYEPFHNGGIPTHSAKSKIIYKQFPNTLKDGYKKEKEGPFIVTGLF